MITVPAQKHGSMTCLTRHYPQVSRHYLVAGFSRTNPGGQSGDEKEQ